MPPTLYIKNALRIAEQGLGDGTVYYSGIGGVIPNQANKTFQFFTLAAIDDLPAPVDDVLNGYILYFPNSRNKYHIVDFVASTSTVTTWEMPDLIDTNRSYWIRRALVDDKALAANPAHRLADGQRYAKWKRSAVGTISISLPNLIKENPGFESGDLSGWSIIAGTPTVNSATPILGKYDAAIGANDRLWALMRGPIKKTTYRVLFKGRAAAGSAGLYLQFVTVGQNFALDYIWSNQSSGTTSGSVWTPALGTSNAWHWADITISTLHDGDAYLAVNNHNPGASPLNLDEVYVFEKVNVGAYWLLDEDNSSGSRPSITGRYANGARTGIVSGIDSSLLVSNPIVGHHKLHEFTGGIFPIYDINFAGVAPSASEIFLCEKWVWQHGPNRPLSFDAEEYDESTFRSRSGVEQHIRHSQRRTFSNTYPSMTEVDRLRLINDWKPHHRDDLYPFAIKMKTGDTPLLMIDDSKKFDNPYNNLQPDWTFKFKEVK